MATYTLNVNGKTETVDADGAMPLLWVLRDKLDLKGTKFGCGVASCGACTVHLDGEVARACVTPISSVGAKRVTTIEAIGQTQGRTGRPESMARCRRHAVRLLPGWPGDGRHRAASTSNAKPTDKDIDTAMAGNACRCGTYVRIREAIKTAAGVDTKDTREV